MNIFKNQTILTIEVNGNAIDFSYNKVWHVAGMPLGIILPSNIRYGQGKSFVKRRMRSVKIEPRIVSVMEHVEIANKANCIWQDIVDTMDDKGIAALYGSDALTYNLENGVTVKVQLQERN